MTATAQRLDETLVTTETATPARRRRAILPTEGHPSVRPPAAAHLDDDQVAALAVELDTIRDGILASRGSQDAAYIRKVIRAQRTLEIAGRASLVFASFPPAWIAGVGMLSVAKIIENMEIGHNVLHGQWDWMRDPDIHSTTWEWDFVTPAA
ncbi:MAG: acyl-CoA desaturase, partial [Lapillicoccus sp.]